MKNIVYHKLYLQAKVDHNVAERDVAIRIGFRLLGENIHRFALLHNILYSTYVYMTILPPNDG